MKLLVIRFSSIGDIVLTTPVVRCLKQQLPGAEVHYLTKASFRSIVAHNPFIDKIHYLEDDINHVINTLKKEHFDYIIDLHHNLRTLRVKRALQVQSYSFRKLNVQKWLLTNLKINLMPDASIVERYMETVQHLGVKNDGRGLDYFIPEAANLKNTDIPMSHWAGYVACVIGGSMNTKKLPVDKWKELATIMPYPMILVGGPEDRADGDAIATQDKVKMYNACGKFNLNESAWLVKNARVVVSNDTGLMHVAAAYKKPIISLWGNTSPEMGMFPYYGNNSLKASYEPLSVIFENKEMSCHPCSKIGYDKCPKGHFRCMNNLNMNEISLKILKFWNNNQPLK
jgi:ADP-heptose:LPS heptosyltransferase